MPAKITGLGATISFGTSAFTAAFTEIGSMDISRDVLDTTTLATSVYKEKTPGDLVDAGDFTATFFYDTDNQPPITGAAELITITFPIVGTGTAAAKISGQGFVSSWSHPTIVADQLMSAELTITWDGGPTFTAQV